MQVSLFDYELPDDRIAQEPRPRGSSRLLVLDRRSGAVRHRTFSDLPSLLAPADVLVRNDVRVRHARLWGRDPEERLVEVFLLERVGGDARRWSALTRPGRRARAGRTLRFADGAKARIESVNADGKRIVAFDRAIDAAWFDAWGSVPIPPYIRRPAGEPDRPADRDAYQTVFAREALAVAAPTAGLHFTSEVLSAIRVRGTAIADLTLAIGAGTFKPVTAEDTEGHRMDAEAVRIPAATRETIRRTRASGGRVVAVGTTVARSLEAAALLAAAPVEGELQFQTDLFIQPGFEFRAVDALLTNFHLPRSTLLMLVSAFAGRETILAAYAAAIREEYLFYSFGDAMLIV
ncbi:MAG: tRNA preQ1(34) S-adenosylmethionine ribosyltransferase-isomerase QueA [Acidobacteriota bacterium]